MLIIGGGMLFLHPFASLETQPLNNYGPSHGYGLSHGYDTRQDRSAAPTELSEFRLTGCYLQAAPLELKGKSKRNLTSFQALQLL